MEKLTITNVKKVVSADSVGKNKIGNIVVRRGFFYTHGMSAEQFEISVCKQLDEAGFKYQVVSKGEHWASFRGSASVRASSHWWVELKEA